VYDNQGDTQGGWGGDVVYDNQEAWGGDNAQEARRIGPTDPPRHPDVNSLD